MWFVSNIKYLFQSQKLTAFFPNVAQVQQSIKCFNVRIALQYYCALVFGSNFTNYLHVQFTVILCLEQAHGKSKKWTTNNFHRNSGNQTTLSDGHWSIEKCMDQRTYPDVHLMATWAAGIEGLSECMKTPICMLVWNMEHDLIGPSVASMESTISRENANLIWCNSDLSEYQHHLKTTIERWARPSPTRGDTLYTRRCITGDQ